MGMDSVELVLAIEEDFGVLIPDEEAEQMLTVGDVYDWLKVKLSSADAVDCLTQQVFYKLRRALVQNYSLDKAAIRPDTRLTDLLPIEVVAEGWPFLQVFIDLKTPRFKVANEILGLRLSDQSLTMRELVKALISLNVALLPTQRVSDAEIWRRLVAVIMAQLNVTIDQIVPEARFVEDLGLC